MNVQISVHASMACVQGMWEEGFDIVDRSRFASQEEKKQKTKNTEEFICCMCLLRYVRVQIYISAIITLSLRINFYF